MLYFLKRHSFSSAVIPNHHIRIQVTFHTQSSAQNVLCYAEHLFVHPEIHDSLAALTKVSESPAPLGSNVAVDVPYVQQIECVCRAIIQHLLQNALAEDGVESYSLEQAPSWSCSAPQFPCLPRVL